MSVANPIQRVCAYCGGTFTVSRPSDPKRYCSPVCSNTARRQPLAERFWPKVDKNGPVPEHRPDLGQCWLWTGAIASKKLGYSVIWDNGKNTYGHRIAYELVVGPISDGLELDHLCRNRRCVNPAHLEPVTKRVNVLRGASPAAMAARADRCAQGHIYTPESTYQRADGRRVCRICTHIWQERSRSRRKETRQDRMGGRKL